MFDVWRNGSLGKKKKIVIKYFRKYAAVSLPTLFLPKAILQLLVASLWALQPTDAVHRHCVLLWPIIVNSRCRKTADWFPKRTCAICIFMPAHNCLTHGAAVTSGPALPHMMRWIIKQRGLLYPPALLKTHITRVTTKYDTTALHKASCICRPALYVCLPLRCFNSPKYLTFGSPF